MNTCDSSVTPHSPLHVIEHARRRARKGKGPTLSFAGINNPREALYAANKLHCGGLDTVKRIITTEQELTEERFLSLPRKDLPHTIEIRYTDDTEWFLAGLRHLGYSHEFRTEVSNWGCNIFLLIPTIKLCKTCMTQVESWGIDAPDRTCPCCKTKTANNYRRAYIFEGKRYCIKDASGLGIDVPVPWRVSVLSFKRGFDAGARSWRERHSELAA